MCIVVSLVFCSVMVYGFVFLSLGVCLCIVS